VYKSWTENIDEGWTRWVLEQHGFAFTSITDADVRAGNLRARFDALVLPSTTADQLVNGNASDVVPPEYAGGLGEIGVEALKKFVEAGGTLICLDDASRAAIAALNLPVRDLTAEAGDRLFCPGSILRLELDSSQPLTYGMTPETAAFFAFGSAYEAVAPRTPTDGHGGEPPAPSLVTIGRYASKDLLLSGWLEGGEVIAGRPAIVQLGVGAGRVVLIGFSPQHRGQSHATFRLLFNAIFTARTEPSSRR
jgi:hypothetical protein